MVSGTGNDTGSVADDTRVEVEGLKEGGREDSVEATPRSQEDTYLSPGYRAWEKETAPPESAAKPQPRAESQLPLTRRRGKVEGRLKV